MGLRIKYDVMADGRAVIKADAPGSGQITLAIRPSVVQAVDGQMVTLTGAGTSSAGSSSVGPAVALAVVVSPLFLLHKSKEASISTGYEMRGNVGAEVSFK